MGQSFSNVVSDPSHFSTRIPSSDSEVLDSFKAYDYVIVGGGTAGCVLASRLSEDPNVSVLLIEAGQKSHLFSTIPLAWGKIFGTSADWGYHSTTQTHGGNRTWFLPRGKLLGGSSATNASVYHRCSPEDFSEWEKEGAEGWSYQEMKKYFMKAESYTYDAEKSLDKETSSKFHGSSGVHTVVHPYATPIMNKIIEAAASIGIPSSKDFNTDAGTLGGSLFQASVDTNGHRVSAATAYLTPDVLARSNLTVAVGVQVEKLSVTAKEGKPVVNGVVMSTRKGGPQFAVFVKKEVIVSSGTFGTPAKSKKITVKHDLPLVGRNLLDHVSSGCFAFRCDPKETWDWVLKPGKGPMASIGSQAAVFVRSDDPKLPYGKFSSGQEEPRVYFAPVIVIENGSKPGPMGSYGISAPATNSIWDGPLIDPKYFSDPNDMKNIIKATKLTLHIARASPLAQYLRLGKDQNNTKKTVKDEDLEAWARRNGSTAFHPKFHANVLFPTQVSGHTCAVVIALAERAADLIKKDYANV
ncbi:GMC oxidoreductase [Flagelloscypha sp. PMI_526]|nr:GMC oxidoreductase [Flagelloscypha sp. PMI_526]